MWCGVFTATPLSLFRCLADCLVRLHPLFKALMAMPAVGQPLLACELRWHQTHANVTPTPDHTQINISTKATYATTLLGLRRYRMITAPNTTVKIPAMA